MNNYKIIESKSELEALIQNNFNDFNGNITRQYEVGNLELLKMIVENYRVDFTFGIKYCGDFYSFHKDKSGLLFGRKSKELFDKPIDRAYDICGNYQEVMDKLAISNRNNI